MPKPAPDRKEVCFDDPNDQKGKGCIPKEMVLASGLHDGSASGGPTWKKVKDMTRGDLMALNGFGDSNAWDNVTFGEMDKVTTALELYNEARYRGKYVCCTCI